MRAFLWRKNGRIGIKMREITARTFTRRGCQANWWSYPTFLGLLGKRRKNHSAGCGGSSRELINRRKAIIQQFKELSENKAKIVVIFYESPQDAGQTLLEMRFNNSLAATLAIDYGVNVVRYNPVDYINWLTENGLVDSPAKRSEWSVDYFLRQKKG
ncbi:hypothetical protein AAUPMG_12141 [Pasteurella multocida subsp. multocida str. Anand1_goat]|nr:hypothetical protein AAUPMG_12141 [Pasteurella multocida subsp. multocida str. Anand1_goat]